MIEIKNLTNFLYPLKTLSSSINSVVFSNANGKLAMNTKAQDGSQFVNMKWEDSVVSIPEDMEKFGIYNLSEFISTLNLFGGNTVKGKINSNKVAITYGANEQVEVNYNLSDISLIQEGTPGPKVKVEYLISFKVDKDFLKKIKDISSSLNIKILKIECKKGEVGYAVSSKDFHSHIVKEKLYTTSKEVKDFELYINIEKLAIIPDSKPLVISINERVTEFAVEDSSNFEVLRYFISPTTME